MYCDPELKKTFAGECNGLTPPRHFVAYKTHVPYFGYKDFHGHFPGLEMSEAYPRAIVVVREPHQALVSEYRRTLTKGKHTLDVPGGEFRTPEWERYVRTTGPLWVRFHRFWVEGYKGRALFVFFEDLVGQLPTEIRRDLKARGLSDPMRHDASFAEAGSLH